jgi:hypothetical protein
MSKKVLIVEADGEWHDKWFRELGKKVRPDGEISLVSALSVQEAKDQFAANPDVAAIVVGACPRGDSPTTVPLVQKLRDTGFRGPMIAVGEKDHRQQLVRAGCDRVSLPSDLPQNLSYVLAGA